MALSFLFVFSLFLHSLKLFTKNDFLVEIYKRKKIFGILSLIIFLYLATTSAEGLTSISANPKFDSYFHQFIIGFYFIFLTSLMFDDSEPERILRSLISFIAVTFFPMPFSMYIPLLAIIDYRNLSLDSLKKSAYITFVTVLSILALLKNDLGFSNGTVSLIAFFIIISFYQSKTVSFPEMLFIATYLHSFTDPSFSIYYLVLISIFGIKTFFFKNLKYENILWMLGFYFFLEKAHILLIGIFILLWSNSLKKEGHQLINKLIAFFIILSQVGSAGMKEIIEVSLLSIAFMPIMLTRVDWLKFRYYLSIGVKSQSLEFIALLLYFFSLVGLVNKGSFNIIIFCIMLFSFSMLKVISSKKYVGYQ